ncbi:helix-turn-helix domain-containing protein [Deminuibacter soli]|uniref:AraC family transcriptional regulator n=1 Tax=Deminuibacter soli TaxID=2291815 RepID=A0A3E1NEA0_9BACT|nr:AraC family transcriptional regulator [Deminuibacter soli]RFM26296.1 AraC family transcriptional regulator [Deminuibacter soli]
METLPVDIISRKDEITAAFFELVETHLAELKQRKVIRRFAAHDFAAQLFIHPRHLSNTIKLTTGQSPCTIMEERVTSEAQQMLADTSLSVAEVGERFGYVESSSFIKFFKGMTGTTPLQYRKKIKEPS